MSNSKKSVLQFKDMCRRKNFINGLTPTVLRKFLRSAQIPSEELKSGDLNSHRKRLDVFTFGPPQRELIKATLQQ